MSATIEPGRTAEDDGVIGATTITISKTEIPVTIRLLKISDLLFYPENPRIYSMVRAGGAVPSQDDILGALRDKKYVNQLVKDIRENGGLMDPVIVRTSTMEVLEGNSRLAAYRMLAENEPTKWGLMKAMMLPTTFDDNMVFALLNQYHLKGKTKWDPYERAGFVYRRWSRSYPKMSIPDLSRECVEDPKEVKFLLDTYKFMTDHEMEPMQWSHAYEYIKSTIIRKQRSSIASFDDKVVAKIKSGELEKATDVRDKLRDICRNEKVLKKFLGDSLTLGEAYDELEDSGATSAILSRIKNFNVWFEDSDKLEGRLKVAEGHEKERLKIEFRRLFNRAKRLQERYFLPKTSQGSK